VISRFFVPGRLARALLRLPRDHIETANFKLVLLRELGVPIVRIMQTIAAADGADGDAAHFQEIYIPPTRRRLLFDSDLKC
jgi:hypothetical protein